MRIILLCGFLGSGKTSVMISLARHLVERAGGGDRTSVAIIENEIGEVSIDGKMVENAGFEVKNIFAGCICCTLGVDLINGINELGEMLSPDYVIIEATGVAYPGAITENLNKYVTRCEGLSVITLVDAERFDILSKAIAALLYGQVVGADWLLLNKVDLVTDAQADEISARLRTLNENAVIFRVSANAGLSSDLLDAIAGGMRNE